MTRKEYHEKFRYELEGLVLDAMLSNRKGAELSLCLRAYLSKIAVILDQQYDALVPADLNRNGVKHEQRTDVTHPAAPQRRDRQ